MSTEPDRLLSVQEASETLGLHYMTVYRYVRTGRVPATYRNGRWYIHESDLASVRVGRASTPAQAEAPESGGDEEPSWPGGDEWIQALGLSEGWDAADPMAATRLRLLRRLVAGDAGGAWAIVDGSLLSHSPTQIYTELIGPSLRLIGEGWAAGRVDVAAEHRATALVLGFLGRLGPQFNRAGRYRPGSVLLAGAEGDHHAVPIMMVGDILRSAGFNVVQLGPNVPVDTVASMSAEAGISAVALSASTLDTAERAGATARAVHETSPGMPVFMGGPAITTAQQAQGLGADGWAADGPGLVSLLDEWTGRSRTG